MLVKCFAQCLAHGLSVNVSYHFCNQQHCFSKVGIHLIIVNFVLWTQILEPLRCLGPALCFAHGRVQEKGRHSPYSAGSNSLLRNKDSSFNHTALLSSLQADYRLLWKGITGGFDQILATRKTSSGSDVRIEFWRMSRNWLHGGKNESILSKESYMCKGPGRDCFIWEKERRPVSLENKQQGITWEWEGRQESDHTELHRLCSGYRQLTKGSQCSRQRSHMMNTSLYKDRLCCHVRQVIRIGDDCCSDQSVIWGPVVLASPGTCEKCKWSGPAHTYWIKSGGGPGLRKFSYCNWQDLVFSLVWRMRKKEVSRITPKHASAIETI